MFVQEVTWASNKIFPGKCVTLGCLTHQNKSIKHFSFLTGESCGKCVFWVIFLINAVLIHNKYVLVHVLLQNHELRFEFGISRKSDLLLIGHRYICTASFIFSSYLILVRVAFA